MTQDDIIRMAKEADVWVVGQEPYQTQLERFAALVATAEREACAKVCDDLDIEYEGEDVLATWCAAAIRARGNNETQTLQDAVRNP